VIVTVLVVAAGGAAASPRADPVSFLSVNSVAVLEGNSGTVALDFTISLAPAASHPVTVTFNTADGIATAPGDYDGISQLVSFAAGETTKTVQVTGHGDTSPEQHEYFVAYISDPNGAVNYRDVGWATLINDDVVGSAPVIRTVAGSGTEGCCGDDYMALGARWYGVDGVAVDSVGHVFLASEDLCAVTRVTLGGTIVRVAGIRESRPCGYNLEGIPAVTARLTGPSAVALGPGGVLYIADTNNHRIRRIGLDGIISVYAGNGASGDSGDEGPATSASISFPEGIAFDGAGNLYIADSGNNRIRRVTTDGKIHALAGTGEQGFDGDGGQAISAQLNLPETVLPAPNGVVYVSDTGNDRIRRIDANGVITTVAGTGVDGFSGDGGPATSARLSYPRSIALSPAGMLFIGDALNNAVRKVDANGVITTVVGQGGVVGFAGDGGPPSQARLRAPTAIAFDDVGRLYISDSGNVRLREVTGL
jgi:sugar lactone lactonase YvrE